MVMLYPGLVIIEPGFAKPPRVHAALHVSDQVDVLIQRDGHGLLARDNGFLVKLIMLRPGSPIDVLVEIE